MKDIKQCITKKTLMILAGIILVVGIIGVGFGAKYLNKSQQDFLSIKNKLITEQEKVETITRNAETQETTLTQQMQLKNAQIEKMKSWKDQKSFVMINRDLLEENLEVYTSLSKNNRKRILDTVLSESEKYNINPIILYSLLHVESTMRFWIQHTPVKITVNKKTQTVQAVGLGGVVWEWWDKQLKDAKIAEVRSDLFNIETNIKASAFILNEFSKREMLKGTKSKDESMLRRYFGGNFKSYSDKIDRKVMSIVRPNLYRY